MGSSRMMGNEWMNKTNIVKNWEYGICIICHMRNILIKSQEIATYQMLRKTRMAFKYLDEETINKFIKLLI